MEKFPGRVYSKPEFTALPPYIFSGAEFALIPSRDEPFGLVAVEFGRKGALGVGARVGGLGNVSIDGNLIIFGLWNEICASDDRITDCDFRCQAGGRLSSRRRPNT